MSMAGRVTVAPVDRDPLDAAALTAAVGARYARVEVVAETESTNSALLDDPDAPDRSVLAAEFQTSGRGRLDRTWASPPRSGLLFSVLVRPAAAIPTWGWLPLLTGVAVRDAVADASGIATALKWPNDLLGGPDERKLCGILAQTSGPAVVLGVGLNVSTSAAELPVDTATSLALCGAAPDRTLLLATILTRLDDWLQRWDAADGDAAACGLADAYRAACATLGREVLVTTTDGRRLSGTAVAIEDDGRLRVETADGPRSVGAGDVEHVRPSS